MYATLRGWIMDGTYTPGSRLPPESELCQLLGVSKMTTGKALNLLVQENLLVRVQGKGTFVVEDLGMARNLGDMDQLIRRVERLKKNSRITQVAIRTITADEETCSDLQLSKGSLVQEVSYVRLIENAAAGYRISYIPKKPGLEITKRDVTGHPIYVVLERRGVPIAGAHHILGACSADAHKATVLNTVVGAPLVRIRMVVLDEDSQPIERSATYYLADRYEHHLYLARHHGGDKAGKQPLDTMG
mgnify:CR=1 FL=1